MRRLLLPLLLWPILGHAQPVPMQEMVPAMVQVCFVPGDACGEKIAAYIDGARSEVRVQAYGFSAPGILSALASARTRGVDVAVILDKSDRKRLCGTDGELLAAGVPVWIDHLPGIAHNKVIVIDRHLTIGGSYNFTRSAETRNAENVTIIDSPAIAARFLRNWGARQAVAESVEGACG